MKRYTFLFLIFYAVSLFAQEEYVPYLQCHYTEKYVKDLTRKEHLSGDEMVLRISRGGSEFYSLWAQAHQAVKDSVFNRGGSLEDWYAARNEILYPSSSQLYVIYKNYPNKGELTLTDQIFRTWYKYSEPLQTPQWKLLEGKKTIAGYECQKATTDFLGRTWEAWFTSDIPVSDGPWKLCGLPGLILEATDADHEFHFTCIEIKNLSQAQPLQIPSRRYLECSREDYVKNLKLWNNDMNGYLQKQGFPMVYSVESDGSQKPYANSNKYNYIER